jgi:hypothetical protein
VHTVIIEAVAIHPEPIVGLTPYAGWNERRGWRITLAIDPMDAVRASALADDTRAAPFAINTKAVLRVRASDTGYSCVG